jgi:unsaturated rhamnogalacturonyl hydrolase
VPQGVPAGRDRIAFSRRNRHSEGNFCAIDPGAQFMRTKTLFLTIVVAATFSGVLKAQEPIEMRLDELAKLPGVIRSHIGVTRKGTRIPCVYSKDDLDPHSKKTRVLLVAGFQNKQDTAEVIELLEWFYAGADAKSARNQFSMSAVPLVNPDDAAPPRFPVKGEAYFSKDNPEAEYLWRWIGMHAPDIVVILKSDKASSQQLTDALAKFAPCGTGKIPTIHVDIPRVKAAMPIAKSLLQTLRSSEITDPSPARRELQNRVDREPLEIAKQLAKVYGHDLSSVQYIPALALVGRIRLGELTGDPSHLKDVERIVAPYVSGDKESLPARFAGSHSAGHLIFSELARVSEDPTKKQRYLELARVAADAGFDDKGQPKPAMPAHSEMSDAVFMGCPILVEAGALTGEQKYIEMAGRHFEFMRKLVLREDGIYRHSPLCDTAWGRGNGFPALGLAWSLSAMPKDHPLHSKLLKEFQNHMQALVKHQDPTGTWHQVIDDDASYREFTATAMITFAMIRGVQSGWLNEKDYGPVIEKAFHAIKMRIASDGTLVDVCTGTGKQKSLRDYYDRSAILGKDARGGAMALLVTTEMARWQREK